MMRVVTIKPLSLQFVRGRVGGSGCGCSLRYERWDNGMSIRSFFHFFVIVHLTLLHRLV